LKKDLFIRPILLVVLFCLSFYSIASSEELSKEITLWHTYTQPARIEAFQKMADEFEKEYSIKVNIEVMTWTGVTEKWPMAYAANTLPEILSCTPNDGMAMWSLGVLAPVNNVVEALGGKEAYISYIDDLNDNGQYIAYPYYGLSRLMNYRKSWLNEIGMDVPNTWSEFLKAAEALNKPPERYGFIQLLNKADNGLTYQFYALLYNNNGKLWDENLNPTLNTSEAIETAKYLKQLYQVAHPKGAMDYFINDTYRLWNSGLTALQFEGIPLLATAYTDAPDVFEDSALGFIPIPDGYPPEKRTNESSPRILVLVKKPEPSQKAAEKFLIFINQKDRKLEFLKSHPFMFPPESAIVNDPRFINEIPAFQKIPEAVKLTFKGMEIGTFCGVEHGVNPFLFLLERNTIEPLFHKIYLEDITIEDAFAEAQANLEKRVNVQKKLLGWDKK